MGQKTRPSLVQIMVCRLFIAMASSEQMLAYYLIDQEEHISIELNFIFLIK